MDDLIFALTLLSALGCGLVAGAFFAFSTFVMKALGRLPTAQGIAAMQSINVVVINPWFMTAMFGTALACVVLAILSFVEWEEPESIYRLAGGALYVLGTILVTIAFNVPRNDALAAADSGKRRWCGALAALPERMDGLEPRADGGGACGGGAAQHGASLTALRFILASAGDTLGRRSCRSSGTHATGSRRA